MVRSFLIVSLWWLGSALPLGAAEAGLDLKLQHQTFHARDGDGLEERVGNWANLTSGTLRLKIDDSHEGWSYDFHYLADAAYSSDFAQLQSQTGAQSPTLFDLDHALLEGPEGNLNHGLDRAWLSYSTPKTVIRVGRQALSWGRGQVFQPFDLFNPFAPDAKDTSYKPGVDIIYGQYLLDSGGDIQVLIVPRRDDGSLSSEESSFAAKWYGFFNSIETDVFVASDYGDLVLGLGASGPVGDALWKVDVVGTETDSEGNVLSLVANFENSFALLGRSATGFVEYHRNGFGAGDQRPLDELPLDLVARAERGQVFVAAKDYLAFGGSIEVTPLLRFAPTVIANLNDASVLALSSADYTLSDNRVLIAGLQIPFGPRRSEFGGQVPTAMAPIYERSPDTFFVRLEQYF